MIFLPENAWEVKESGKKGRGIYTKSEIQPGTVIGDYLGTIIDPINIETPKTGEHFYAMYYHDYAAIIPDLTIPDLYLINHSCTPNCWIYTYKGHTLFFALRRIFPGEELTISYLLSPQDKFCNPCTHICHCDGIICYQTMHLSEKRFKEWTQVHEDITRKTKKQRITYNKPLKSLKEYPTKISDHPIYILFGNDNEKGEEVKISKFPTIQIIRKEIRNSGRIITLTNVGVKIVGISDEKIIVEPL